MQLTFHYRQVPEDLRPAMVEKAEKIIAGNGFKVKRFETTDRDVGMTLNIFLENALNM